LLFYGFLKKAGEEKEEKPQIMPDWHKEPEPRLEVTAICARTSWRSQAPPETSKWEKNPTRLSGEQSFIYCSPMRAAGRWLHLQLQMHILL